MRVVEKKTGNVRNDLKPGVYQHYKGGLYIALFMAQQGEVLDKPIDVVVYASMTTGDIYTRPYYDRRFDSWTDLLLVEEHLSLPLEWVRRFMYVGPQPVPAQEVPADGNV